jgi:hypothetical protein
MAIIVQDSFNRVDSSTTLGTADSGQTWQALSGTWGITGGKAYSTTANTDISAIVESNISDLKVSALLRNNNASIAFRVIDSNNYLTALISPTEDKVKLYSKSSGSFSLLAEITNILNIDTDYTLSITANGSSITVNLDGVEIISHTSTFNQNATKHGLRAFDGADNNCRWDDFLVEDLNTGTTGSTAFDVRNVLYWISSFGVDSRQSFYSTSALNYDVKQAIYETLSRAFDIRNVLYNTSSIGFDSQQSIFNVSATSYDTQQAIYETISVMYDTLQQITDSGISGSTNFDMRMSLYAEQSNIFDTKQSYFTTGANAYDLKQAIYESSQMDGDIHLVIYADTSTDYDVRQSIFAEGLSVFDTQQTIFDPDMSLIGTVQLQGNRQLNVYLSGKQALNVNLKGLIQ